jgi:hypothetical protein
MGHPPREPPRPRIYLPLDCNHHGSITLPAGDEDYLGHILPNPQDSVIATGLELIRTDIHCPECARLRHVPTHSAVSMLEAQNWSNQLVQYAGPNHVEEPDRIVKIEMTSDGGVTVSLPMPRVRERHTERTETSEPEAMVQENYREPSEDIPPPYQSQLIHRGEEDTWASEAERSNKSWNDEKEDVTILPPKEKLSEEEDKRYDETLKRMYAEGILPASAEEHAARSTKHAKQRDEKVAQPYKSPWNWWKWWNPLAGWAGAAFP